VVLKFGKKLAPQLKKQRMMADLISLYFRFPNTTILHEKLTQIIKGGLRIRELQDEILYSAGLVKSLLSLTKQEDHLFLFSNDSKTHQSYYPFLIELANYLIKLTQREDEAIKSEIQQMIDSTPEWSAFQEKVLSIENEALKQPLGGKDPRMKIESLFDDNDGGMFKGFKDFKPVNTKDIPLPEGEESEEDSDDKELDEEDFEKYFEDTTEEEGTEEPDFGKTGNWMSNQDRYNTIEQEDDWDDS
jgi:hypothetical protein